MLLEPSRRFYCCPFSSVLLSLLPENLSSEWLFGPINSCRVCVNLDNLFHSSIEKREERREILSDNKSLTNVLNKVLKFILCFSLSLFASSCLSSLPLHMLLRCCSDSFLCRTVDDNSISLLLERTQFSSYLGTTTHKHEKCMMCFFFSKLVLFHLKDES